MVSESLRSKIGLYARCLSPSYLPPKLEVDNLEDISISDLRKAGIKALIFDADNTLTHFGECRMASEVRRGFDRLTDNFHYYCVVSNTDSKRAERLCRNLHHARVFALPERKPRRQPFVTAFDYLNAALGAKAELHQVAVIGDRLLTDIAGANMLGMYTIRVKPLNWTMEPLNHSVVRGFENFVLGLYRE